MDQPSLISQTRLTKINTTVTDKKPVTPRRRQSHLRVGFIGPSSTHSNVLASASFARYLKVDFSGCVLNDSDFVLDLTCDRMPG
jgi:hypothetical protein